MPLPTLLGHLPFHSERYLRTLVHRCDRFELLLLTWPPGSASPVHDHGGQHCWFVPLAGTFDLDDYAILDESAAGDARLTRLRSRTVGGGELDRRDADEAVHAVRLASRYGVSLHLYARPVDRCRVFDLQRGRWQPLTLGYDQEAPHLAE